MRIYCGRRDPDSGQARRLFVLETSSGREYDIVERPSPGTTGFEWGYAGTGPDNTARAILDDLLGEVPDWVGDFERGVIAELKRPNFDLAEETVFSWMDGHGHR